MKSIKLRIFTLMFWSGLSSLVEASGLIQLTGEEIRQVFSNVKDIAQVQDLSKTRATNMWLDDGRFTSTWRNENADGIVTGTWYVQDSQRCVSIQTGLPKAARETKCGPIYRQDDRYFSVNSDGSIHGIHQILPLDK
jgi:hypothetical protein